MHNNRNFANKEAYIRKLFSEIAPTYELINHILSFNLDRWWRRKAVARFFRPAHCRILDACCGTGELTEILRQKLPPHGSVVGIDFCEDMLHIARQRHQHTGNVHYQRADIKHLSFRDGSFDAVYICFALRNIDDIPAALREMRRVIKPGGQLVVIDLTLPDSPLPLWYLRHVVPLIGRLCHGSRGPYSYLSSSIRHFDRPEELLARLINEGFEQVEYMRLLGGVVTAVCGTVPKRTNV